jgi:hypothetical protein
MSENLKKVMRQLLVSALIVFMILIQIVPAVVSAESTSTETVNPILLERAQSRQEKSNKTTGTNSSSSNIFKNWAIRNGTIKYQGKTLKYLYEDISNALLNIGIGNTKFYQEVNDITYPVTMTLANRGGHSADGRAYYSHVAYYLNDEPGDGRVGKWYHTAKYWSEQNQKLKQELDKYFGEKNLFLLPSVKTNVYGVNYMHPGRESLWHTITYKDDVYKALKSKTQRNELAKIAVENGLIQKESDKGASYVGLFTYYGILNREDGLLDYDSSSTAYLSREQAGTLINRFMHPDSYFGSVEGKYTGLPNAGMDYGYNMFNDFSEKPLTAKEMKTNMTRLEFITCIMGRYFGADIDEARQDGNDMDAARIFKDIDKSDYGTSDFYKSKGAYGKGHNEASRAELKYKKLGDYTDAHVQAAFKLGVLTKDSKGNANLFKYITYDEAMIMLINSAIAQADGKAL